MKKEVWYIFTFERAEVIARGFNSRELRSEEAAYGRLISKRLLPTR